MKYTNREIITCLFLWLLTVSACTYEKDSIVSDKGEKKICLTLSSDFIQGNGVSTRSASKAMELIMGEREEIATRALSNVESEIQDFSLLLFSGTPDSPSEAKLLRAEYVTGTNEVGIVVGNADFVYVCANVGDITGNFTVNTSTYQNILNTGYTLSSGQSALETSLPMEGMATNFQSTVVKVTLTRMVAKITFNCNLGSLPVGDTFVIKSATLCNVPKSVSYGMPDVTPGDTPESYDEYVGAGTVSGNTTTYTWYMPENKKKSDKTISVWQERFLDNAPAYGTYIKLVGDYTTGGEVCKATYIIYLGNGSDVNNYEVLRNHRYMITSTIKGINIEDKRVTVVTDIDLSADGLANCYLASKDNRRYCFNATIRGNGQREDYAAQQYPGLSLLPSPVPGVSDPLDISSGTSAKLIWETVTGVIKEVKLEDGYVKFSTGTAKGNALIGVYAADGTTVLWSWHIWRTNGVDLADLETTYSMPIKTYLKRVLRAMDRNLGSAFNGTTPTFDDCDGVNALYYQFGRKDPFPAPNAYSQTTGLYKTHVEKTAISGALASIDRTIKEPWMFVIHPIYTNSWIDISFNTNSNRVSDCLWGDNNTTTDKPDPTPWGTAGENGKKTIYDPCPSGWRVSPLDTWWGILTETALNSFVPVYSTNRLSLVDKVGSFNKGWTMNVVTGDNTKRTIFFPAIGIWNYASSTTLILHGENAVLWETSPVYNTPHASYFDSTATSVVQGRFSRSYGIAVRCVQESSVPK